MDKNIKNLKEIALNYFSTMLEEGKAKGLLVTSIECVKSSMNQINYAIDKKDYEALRKGFHSLKGTLLNSGLNGPGNLAFKLEKMATMRKNIELIVSKNIFLFHLLDDYCKDEMISEIEE